MKNKCRWCLQETPFPLDELGYCSNYCRAEAGNPHKPGDDNSFVDRECAYCTDEEGCCG